MIPAGDVLVGEALKKNSKEQNLLESSGQLLHCSHIFYCTFHCRVSLCTCIRNGHGGVRSAAVPEASLFRESNVANNIRQWYSHLLSEKAK